jgi:hypothetical protein
MKIGKQPLRPLQGNPNGASFTTTLSENFMEKAIVKAKAKSKKELIREIMEIDSPLLGGGDFNMESLSRTNIQNLDLILRMLKA